MIEVKGDITFVTHGIIVHQVNAKGVMGAGVSLQLRDKWPAVYDDYDITYRRQELRLGHNIYTNIVKNNFRLQVASMCAQEDYGVRGVRYTSYKAFKKCLKSLVMWHVSCLQGRLPVYFSHEIGCDLAGGEWVIIKPLLEEYFPKGIIMKKPEFSRA